MKKIPVINKSRAKKVDVRIESMPEELKEDPIFGNDSPEELEQAIKEIVEEPCYCEMPEDKSSLKYLAERLAILPPKEMRKVVSAAKHLRKFVDILGKDEAVDEDWED